jgi:hypothetical protein
MSSDFRLLIAGISLFDDNLSALLTEWARTDADYLTRVAHLNGTQNGGLNGGYRLTSQRVTGNGGGNDLCGDLGQDGFWAAAGHTKPDDLHDLDEEEIVTNL